jgi:pyruvate/2-oxoglutarate dehydrogenase complex dihydrolipoamide acyltransferase (E2) component
MPQMGVSVEEGTVLVWFVGPGDAVDSGQTICEISTDKVETDLPAPLAGIVSEVLVAAGETVSAGTVLARIDPGGAGRPRRTHSPVVLRVAVEHDVDLGHVVGTGRNGRVTKRDVLAFVDAREAAPTSEREPAEVVREREPTASPSTGAEPSRMRQTIAERMTHSLRTAAHCHTFIEVDMSRVEVARRALGIGPLPFFARACIGALRLHPVLNSRFEESGLSSGDPVNLGIAVSLGDDGLIVPVIHDAQELSVEGLSERIKDLAARARSRRLDPGDVQGGTFTITNLGAFGTLISTPIINQPQVGILDVQAIVKRAIVVDDAIAIRPMTILGLGWDHRALDGAQAAGFLATLRDTLQSWPTPAA